MPLRKGATDNLVWNGSDVKRMRYFVLAKKSVLFFLDNLSQISQKKEKGNGNDAWDS